MYLEEVQCHMHPHTDIYFVRDVKNTRIKYTLEAKLILETHLLNQLKLHMLIFQKLLLAISYMHIRYVCISLLNYDILRYG